MDATTADSSARIGRIFVDKGLIAQEQLERALELQEESGERLGEILVTQFGVARLDLASALAEQWAVLEREGKERDDRETDALPAPPPVPAAPAPDVSPALLLAPFEHALERLRDRVEELGASLSTRLAVAEEQLGARSDPRDLDTRVGSLRAELDVVCRQLDELRAALSEQSARAGAEAAAVRELVAASEQSRRAELESVTARLAELERGTEVAASPSAEQPVAAARVAEEALCILDTLVSRTEENDAAAIDERERLREELERALAAHDARLERVEALLQEPSPHRIAEEAQTGEAAEPLPSSPPSTAVPERATPALAFVPLSEGYRLVELAGDLPGPGGTVTVPEHAGEFTVVRAGRSPIPSDVRPCVFLERR